MIRPAHLYHGTTAKLEPGDVVESKRGGGRSRVVYMTDHPVSARHWAEAKAARSGGMEADPDDPTGWGTRITLPVYVYEVDAPRAVWAKTGWTAPEATVIRRVAHRPHGSMPWQDNPRPVPLSERHLDGIADSIATGVAKTAQRRFGSRPMQDGEILFFEQYDDLGRDVTTGRSIPIEVLVRASAPDGQARQLFVLGGAMGTNRRTGVDHVQIYVDASWSGDDLAQFREYLARQIRVTLAHEVRHASQFKRGNVEEESLKGLSQQGARYRDKEGNVRWDVYLNDPDELEARLGDVVTELRQWLTTGIGMKIIQKGIMPRQGIVKAALGSGSPTYQEIAPHLTKENERRVLRAAYQEIQREIDQGHDLWEAKRRENPVADPQRLAHRVHGMRTLVDHTHRRHDPVVAELRPIDRTQPLTDAQKAAYRAASFEAGVQALYVLLVTEPRRKQDEDGSPIVHADSLFRDILQAYDLPADVRTKVEKASRYFAKTRTPARTRATSPIAYYDRNMREIDAALAAAETALRVGTPHHEAAAKEGAARVVKAGTFTLVNTGGFDRETMERAARVVARAEEKLQARGFGELCYGEVAITNTIAGERTLAFYNPDQDELFVRANLEHVEKAAEETILHELAHRYQKMHPKTRRAEAILFSAIERIDDDELRALFDATWEAHKPKVGDIFTSPEGKTYTVAGFDVQRGKIWVKLSLPGSPYAAKIPAIGYFVNKGLLTWQSHAFVTQYAKKSPSENFAEMFAQWMLGGLRPDQLALFETAMESSR